MRARASRRGGRVDARGALRLLGVAAFLLAGAGLFDCEPLFVPAATLLVLALGALGWALAGALGARVERSVGVRRAVEGEAVEVRLSARGGPLGLLGATLDDPLVGAPRRLGWRRRERLRVQARFARRGRRELAPPSLRFGDPLGLAAARVDGDGPPASVLVLPRVEPVVGAPRAPRGRGARARRGRGGGFGAAEVELDGLRPAREGTSAARIHWPSLARGAGLMERRLRPEADARPLVALDARLPADEAALDAAVRATASLAVHLARHGGGALLLPGDRRPVPLDADLHGWTAQHVRLALLEGGAAPLPAALSGRRGPLLLVVAHVPARVPRLLLASPSSRRVLIVPGELAGRRAAFAVGGCHGYVLGSVAGERMAA
ncbi:MAG: DUF58 domain-containing protein [Solirubrobacteraceae bacterium]|nr:DUF58 domain-containing protein [Solirubrobacteraceae bacterium]